MFFKEANLNEIEEIYTNCMLEDFPPAELKKLEDIIYSVKKGWYAMHIAYDDEGVKGYACIAKIDCDDEKIKKFGFLDYYAIVKKYRGTGIGSLFLSKLNSLSGTDCIILETESVRSAKNESETQTRERRIAFYERAGCVDTGCMYNVFGVEYNIFINKDISLTEEFLSKLLSAYEYAYAAILRRNDKDYIYRVK